MSFADDDDIMMETYEGWGVDMFVTAQLSLQPATDYPLLFYGVGAYPRYNFYAPQDYYSIAVGLPLNAGLDAYGSSAGSYYQYFIDVPVELTFNAGYKATLHADYYMGGYLGAGLDYNYSVISSTLGTKIQTIAIGPMISGGLRYEYMGRPVGLRASFMWGLINNFEEDPCNCIEYENGTTPRVLSLSLTYGAY